MPQPSVSYRDIAREAECSATTVSRVLNNDARVLPSTADRVVAAIEELGYQRDPRIAELMRHLRNRNEAAFRETLGWVSHLPRTAWDCHASNSILEGAKHAAASLGYAIDPITVNPAASHPELERLLITRGIRGLIIEPFGPEQLDWKIDWSRFTTVTIGTHPTSPHFHRVDTDDFSNTASILSHLTALGYRRIGLLQTAAARFMKNLAAGAYFSVLTMNEALPVFELQAAKEEVFAPKIEAWLEQHEIDAVLTTFGNLDKWLKKLGWRIPGELGLAHVCVTPDDNWAGIMQDYHSLGFAAVEVVAQKLETGRLGSGEPPVHRLITGKWKQGETVQPQTAGPAERRTKRNHLRVSLDRGPESQAMGP